MKNYKGIPTTLLTDDLEVGKYTTMYTDIGSFEIHLPLEELQKQLKEANSFFGNKLFVYEKLDEYSKVMEHYGRLVIDLKNTKILGFKEHIIMDNLKARKEIKDNDNLEIKE